MSAATVGLAGLLASVVLLTAIVDPEPASLADADEIGEWTVTALSYDDPRVVELRSDRTESAALVAGFAGRVTASTCRAGDPLVSSASPFSIDGLPVVALATEVPLWRDLAVGDRGDDVAALQKELARLGHHVVVDGVMGNSTMRAAQEAVAQGDQVTERLSEGLEAALILWVPDAAAELSECSVSTGDFVEAGDVLARRATRTTGVEVVDMPSDLLEGERVLRLGDSTVPVDAGGRATEPVDTASLTQAAPTSVAEPGEPASRDTTTATLALAMPLSVGVVPPSSLYDIVDGEACVQTGGRPERVRLAGQRLGQSLVVPSAGSRQELPGSVEVSPRGTPSCR